MGFVYIIVNKITNAAYIGSTLTTIENRYRRHVKDLKTGIHHSIFLQRAWNKYGESNFEVVVLEEVMNSNDVICREQFYLDERKRNFPSNKNYNICWTAGNCQGRVLSEETKQKISKSQIGRKNSLESKLKCSNTHALRYGKKYIFVDPNGGEYETSNIRAFARHNKLSEACLGCLARKKIKHHRGWTLKGLCRKTFAFVSPDGVIYDNILHLKEFCKTHGLRYKGMSRLYLGGAKTCQGWYK